MPLQVLPFFAEGQSFAAQAAHQMPHGEIHTLNKGSIDLHAMDVEAGQNIFDIAKDDLCGYGYNPTSFTLFMYRGILQVFSRFHSGVWKTSSGTVSFRLHSTTENILPSACFCS